MALISYKPITKSRRFRIDLVRSEITKSEPEKSLTEILKKTVGRSHGQVVARHRGGIQKRYYRIVDFKRDKRDMEAKVIAIEYDPNRNVSICLGVYKDGEKRYILFPEGVKVGDKIIASKNAPIKPGNA